MRRAAVVKTKTKNTTPPKRIKGETVAPDYLLRLMEHIGPSEAARKLGTTTSTLFKARRMNLVTPAFEIAARGIWMENNYAAQVPELAARPTAMHRAVASPQQEGVVLYMIQVPSDRAQMLERTAKMLGAVIVAMD